MANCLVLDFMWVDMHTLTPEKLGEKIRKIYTVVAELSDLFPNRRFTPDGHMVGSLGEAIAAIDYGVELFPNVGHPAVDGRIGNREVQVKTTQGKNVAVKEPRPGDLLLVIKLNLDGTWERIYDGDSARVWNELNGQKETRAGEKVVSFIRLRKLQPHVLENDRIKPLTRQTP